ncbi:hypothetical protein O1Q96_04510 [Streptomyces sp. Qhu-G9]|uniref:hypothetical protein n=1 Tax=Streptomyces sp. Qhu-G9 TaxID=3452799 RepID=UPI0022ABE427|nr:hypothetical protein [Streptomyces aurantiacus]WAU79078.1 hypothetical protein O1Q96_04510 [Streptomyces aurantiacus]
MTSGDVTYRYSLDLGPGWVDLTLAEGSKGAARELAAARVAQFNPLRLAVERASLVDTLTRMALKAYESGAVVAGSYFSDSGINIATLELAVFGDEGIRPTPEDVQPMILEWENMEVVGTPEVRYLDLSAGRAVRVQAAIKEKKLFGRGRLAEFIRYAVCPANNDDVVLVTVQWNAFQYSDELTQMVDDMIGSLSVESVDQSGEADSHA